MRNILIIRALLLIHLAAASTLVAETKPLVYIGEDGTLKYTADAKGNTIPDFSRAGYMGGGVKIPDVPVRKTLSPLDGNADDTARIQAAIDEVAGMKLDGSKFRGAVLLKRGTYRVAGTLKIAVSGVVLRGEGQKTDGTVIIATGTKKRTLISVGGKFKITETEGTRRKITDSYVPWGTKALNLESVQGYSVGDKVVVHRVCTQKWLDHIGMSKLGGRGNSKVKPWTVEGYQFHFERVITAIDGLRITLDAPIVNAIEDEFGGGFVYRYTEEARISQVGVEHLRLVSEFGSRKDENHAWTGVNINSAANAWARNITAVHFGWGGVSIGKNGKFITVQDCSYLKPVSRHIGGRRYPYQCTGQMCLVQRCYSEGGRHCNVAGPRSRGPNVYLDCYNEAGDAGPHHRWAMGALYDNVKTPIICARNRGGSGSGHGWTGAQIVFWNCEASGMKIERPPTGELYVIGCKIKGKPEHAHVESHGKPVAPRSLYLAQLEDRLGKRAVENITTEAQRKGTIYKLLKEQLALQDSK